MTMNSDSVVVTERQGISPGVFLLLVLDSDQPRFHGFVAELFLPCL